MLYIYIWNVSLFCGFVMVTPSWLYFISHHLLIYLQIIPLRCGCTFESKRSSAVNELNVSSLASPQQWAQICGRLSRREGWFQLRLACDREQKCRRRWIKSTDAHVDVLWLHNDTTDCVSAQTALSLQAQINQTTLRPQSHAGRIQHLWIWQIQDHGTRLVTL